MNIPRLAYGTWVDNIQDAPTMKDRVINAIHVGYRHIDTARNYGTEPYVIEGIQASGISRDEIYFTSKVQSIVKDEVLRKTLDHMVYYDLLLLHYPPMNTQTRNNFKRTILPIWIGMNNYLQTGIAKSIGVSNFYQNHLELLLEVCDEYGLTRPLVNQIEIHPGNLELNYVPYMQSEGVIPFAHTPLGGLGSQYILNNDILIAIGTRIGATPAQVVLAYLLSRVIGVVTTSSQIYRMKESIHASDFTLTPEDIRAIDSTDAGFGPIIEGSIMSWSDNAELY